MKRVLPFVYFALTATGVLALFLLLTELDLPRAIITAVVAIALAEYLMLGRGWKHTGVESALWIGALFALVAEYRKPGNEEILLYAAASAVAGARVRNPLFGALAAVLVTAYVEQRWDAGVLFALAGATIAVAALCRTWRRASNEWLFIAIALILPLAGIAAIDKQWRTTTIALYAAFGAIALVLAIVKRHHALFFASMIGFAVAATELSREIDIRLEAKLAGAGALLLTLSFVIARILRDRTTGFVATKENLTVVDDLAEIAATISVPQPETEAAPAREGGEFGGAGASGRY